jgi:hypothetical protein
MSRGRGPCRGPSTNAQHLKDTTSAIAVQARDDVLIAKYGRAWRWWPAPESRKKGSQRWTVPAVEHWHPAASIAEIGATFQAWESTL